MKLKVGDVVTWESNDFDIGEIIGFNHWPKITWVVLRFEYHGLNIILSRLPDDLIKVGSIL